MILIFVLIKQLHKLHRIYWKLTRFISQMRIHDLLCGISLLLKISSALSSSAKLLQNPKSDAPKCTFRVDTRNSFFTEFYFFSVIASTDFQKHFDSKCFILYYEGVFHSITRIKVIV